MVTVRADHGGGSRHIDLLLKHFTHDVEAHVACPDEPPYRERFAGAVEGRIYDIPHRRFDFRRSIGLASYVRRNQIEIIHAHGKGAGLYARIGSMLSGRPCIHTPHGVHTTQYGQVTRGLYLTYEHISSRWVERLVFVSEDERVSARAQGLWSGLPNSVILNGVDDFPSECKPVLREKARRDLGVMDERPVVLTLSRFDFAKNMREAYDVVRRLPECLFVWVGDGEDANELRREKAADQVDNLIMLGAMDDPTPWLAAADIYFSSSRWEGLPLAVLEAMSMGTPIVASDVSGHIGLVGESGSGLLYTSGRPDEAVKAIRRLASDEGLRHQLGSRALEAQRKQYSAVRMAHDVESLYHQFGATT